MPTAKNPFEKRDGGAILLKLSVEEFKLAKEIAESKHLKPTTWLYTVFKTAVADADTVTTTSHNTTQ